MFMLSITGSHLRVLNQMPIGYNNMNINKTLSLVTIIMEIYGKCSVEFHDPTPDKIPWQIFHGTL